MTSKKRSSNSANRRFLAGAAAGVEPSASSAGDDVRHRRDDIICLMLRAELTHDVPGRADMNANDDDDDSVRVKGGTLFLVTDGINAEHGNALAAATELLPQGEKTGALRIALASVRNMMNDDPLLRRRRRSLVSAAVRELPAERVVWMKDGEEPSLPFLFDLISSSRRMLRYCFRGKMKGDSTS